MNEKSAYGSIDEYISTFSPEIQEKLQMIRQVIREAAPAAKEKISYQMPTFVLHGNLVHFAAFKHHIGFYPAPKGIEAFEEELAPYRTSKGTLQFPFDRPIPYDLIRKIVMFRAAGNAEKAAGKSKKKN